ncbi:MAG: nitrous oxide reductase family maturation protein NosD [Candidatus Nanoarchaeia archaeon]
MRRATFTVMLTLLLVGMLTFAVDVRQVSSEPATIIVPEDYPTIQEAINAAGDGDTVFARNGTYYEHVVVDRAISLIGEDLETVIDGSSTGRCIWVRSNDVELRGFTVRRGGVVNIDVSYVNGTLIKDNIIRDVESYWGISVSSSLNNTIEENIVRNCGYGIFLESSSYNLIVRNALVNNSYGIILKTAPYNPKLPPPPPSSFNTIYHNNFMNNDVQAEDTGYSNVWNSSFEGNYWSNYNGTDTDGDGIGDTYLPWEDVDNYPFMRPYMWWNLADVNFDFKVDIYDIVLAVGTYGSKPSDTDWNPHCDIAEPYGITDIYDVVMIVGSFGEEYNP